MSAAHSGSLPPLSEEERAIFANAIRQARMLQRTLGPLCEVAIHDFRDLEHSLIHLEGSLTGRKLGAPITNIVVKAWRQQGDDVADIVGYPSSTPGGKSLKSSTSFLRRADGRVIGAFCMNIDLSDLLHFQAVLHPLLHVDPLERDVSETFAACTGDTSLEGGHIPHEPRRPSGAQANTLPHEPRGKRLYPHPRRGRRSKLLFFRGRQSVVARSRRRWSPCTARVGGQPASDDSSWCLFAPAWAGGIVKTLCRPVISRRQTMLLLEENIKMLYVGPGLSPIRPCS